jgi:4-hydroxybenzoate polyprenyltransferase
VVLVPFAPWLLPFRLAYHALGFAYNWPLFGGRRIKQLYFWKNTASALGFMLTVFCYPLAWARGQLWYGIGWSTVLATAIYFFLFELSYEVIYYLRDAPGDARAEVRTYPVVHGERGAVRIIDALCIASLVVIAAAYLAHVVPWRIAILGVGPLLQIFLYKRFVKRGISSRDCVNITWLGAALLLAYHGWVLAGLPGVA